MFCRQKNDRKENESWCQLRPPGLNQKRKTGVPGSGLLEPQEDVEAADGHEVLPGPGTWVRVRGL